MTRYLLAASLLAMPTPGPPPAFYTTYTYTAYTVVDLTTGEPPTQVAGVGGTLTLRADGTYAKRLSLLLGDSGPRLFFAAGQVYHQGRQHRLPFYRPQGLGRAARHLPLQRQNAPAQHHHPGLPHRQQRHLRAGGHCATSPLAR